MVPASNVVCLIKGQRWLWHGSFGKTWVEILVNENIVVGSCNNIACKVLQTDLGTSWNVGEIGRSWTFGDCLDRWEFLEGQDAPI